VRQGAILAGIGLGIGLLVAFALTRWMASILYGVSATDAVVFVGVSMLLGGVTLIAGYLPARRAAQVEPMIALRCQ
jgi:ABC-type antimicrobial peptide transport system permease subunit